MAIKIQDIVDKCNFLLDAEDSDRYTFDNDFKQAAILTQQWFVSLYNKFFGENKISEESLTELVSIKAFWMGSANRLFFPVQNGVQSENISINGNVVDNGDGTVKIPFSAAEQGVETGEYILIIGTTNYDGFHQIVSMPADKTYFCIPEAFVVEDVSTKNIKVVHKFWTLIGIYPEITTIPLSPTPPAVSETGSWAPDVMVNQVLKSCTRLTFEEWTERQRNPFVPGSELIINSELKEYAYLPAAHYYPAAYTASPSLDAVYEYLIMPSRDKELIGVGFLKRPLGETIVHSSNIIPFPESLIELVVEKFLQFISIKEDDRRSLYDISEAEIQKAFLLLS